MTSEAQPALNDTATSDTSATFKFAGLTKAQMNDYRREYGEEAVRALSAPVGKGGRLEIVVRAPSRDEYDRYIESMVKIEKKTAQALAASRTLLLACLLAPTPSDVKATLDRYPALVDKFTDKVLEMAGAEAEVREEVF